MRTIAKFFFKQNRFIIQLY